MKNIEIGFLGPEGSWSDLACIKYNPKYHKISCKTIKEIIKKVSKSEIGLGFVPLENILEGPINETLDALLEYHELVEITDSHVMEINHALALLPGSDISQISQVYSHPQALAQCSSFLDLRLSRANRITTISSSQALEKIIEIADPQNAAIAAPESIIKHNLYIQSKNIADRSGNKTRFVVVSKKGSKNNYTDFHQNGNLYATSAVICPQKDRQGLLHEILDIISIQQKINILSLHSRPDSLGGFVFYIELEGHKSSEALAKCINAMEKYCQDKTSGMASLVIFGSYPRQEFYRALIQTIGIVGGLGKMGQWFNDFFASTGKNVIIYDKKSPKLSPKKLAEESDAIIFSVPTNAISHAAEQIIPYCKKDVLLIENCSVKRSSLKMLEKLAKPGQEVLGMHTMFGSNATSLIKDQNIIFSTTSSSKDKANEFQDIFYKYGAKLHKASADEHDQATAIVQGLLHLVSLALGQVIAGSFRSKNEMTYYSTPNSRGLENIIRSIVTQNPEIILAIQRDNPEASRLRKKFLEIFFNQVFALERKEKDELLSGLKEVRKFFQT